jgi:DNA-binding NarL/FixJ family response regulator
MCGFSSEPSRKRVLIVDDHYIIRKGLTELLGQQPDLIVCAVAANAEEALELTDQQGVDLALVDISLGQMDGLQLTEELKRRHPNLIVLILSMHDELHYGKRALGAGASGFVAKQNGGEVLLQAIREVLGGQSYYRSSN